ncbi:mannitol dehydrogenase family protein [uncultured Litoreibacter sp.]|uniref:mannitol dehydrogenase family protein n=1 Tax=uncultured Litoreibacter sp. TaxID=1392394 RepID=UPI0026293887|nr:mannitol dehydrogenase family protein [uncultured Litoreibacter sp.]
MTEILHFGIGNFHRAHQAWYTHHANLAAGEDWSIIGVSLRSPAMRDTLNPQGFDYTLAIRDAAGETLDRISVLDDILFADPNDTTAQEAVLNAAIKADIITLTVTEKGYHLGPDGQLDLDHAAIRADLAGTPTTVYSYLFHALQKRDAPVTIISCDNLSANGDSLSTALDRFAGAMGKKNWPETSFPNTMVDRITPATTDALRNHVANKDMRCASPVETETFCEWVIEDRFVTPRPAWDKVGAQIVTDATPYELRKLRLLNGAHSALAYAGTLAGFEYVHQAIAEPELRALVNGIFDEASATLPSGIETENYRAALLDRFANPALKHRLRQIAMDGTLKLPVRLLGTIEAHDGRAPWCRKAVEAWMDFAISETWAGSVVDDPKSADIKAACTGETPKADLAKLIGYTG